MEGPEWKALPPGDCPSILTVSPIKATLPKAEREVSMAMEVRELLSSIVLDMSGHVSENSTPKRLNPVVVLTPPPTNWEIPLGQWTHHPRWVSWMMLSGRSILEEVLVPPLPQLRCQGPAVALLLQMQAIYEKRPIRP